MSQAKVDIVLNEPVGTIAPQIYGHFMEHLGACIYDGCWVGRSSPIPNTDGFRNDVIAALRHIKASVIRWPGGCFADDYHWEDGVGPAESRPKRVNVHWGNVIDSNEVGTHEFVRFCQLVGAEPYFAGNLGSGSVREMRDWVEYCNFPDGSSLASKRAQNGSAMPLGVRYWGVGNENWGCGGNFTPEDYGTEYRRYSGYLRDFGDTPLFLIACGPSGNDIDWTRRFLTKIRKDFWSGTTIHGLAAHYYCGTAGTSSEYTEDQWYQLLYQAAKMEALVIQQRALLDAFDPERKIGLIVDEWGTWHPAEAGRNAAFLWQQNTIRDAQVAAITLNVFNRHADKVVMSNIAQTINVLQAMILTEDDRMVTTPTYHAYDLFSDHQGGESLRTIVKCAPISLPTGHLDQLSVSSSLKGSVLTVTLANADCASSLEVRLRLIGGGTSQSIDGTMLESRHGGIRALNCFDDPDNVGLTKWDRIAGAGTSELTVQLELAGIAKLSIEVQ
ncbi:MAG: alpha-L-arabinofuranosidase C-terminal domain-containing protein [Fimbriimonas sp.]|nr:alpha-L-arabinofuranosidase C-terminal domain-containing protein [Fimbriimonas sp.]